MLLHNCLSQGSCNPFSGKNRLCYERNLLKKEKLGSDLKVIEKLTLQPNKKPVWHSARVWHIQCLISNAAGRHI